MTDGGPAPTVRDALASAGARDGWLVALGPMPVFIGCAAIAISAIAFPQGASAPSVLRLVSVAGSLLLAWLVRDFKPIRVAGDHLVVDDPRRPLSILLDEVASVSASHFGVFTVRSRSGQTVRGFARVRPFRWSGG